MIVRSVEELAGTGREVRGDAWTSTRLLVAADEMGFTLTQTIVEPGMDAELHYTHHLEACLVIEGAVEVTDRASGEVHTVPAGSMYALDRHDRHRIRALERSRLVCVFAPALTGTETHRPDGSYAPPR